MMTFMHLLELVCFTGVIIAILYGIGSDDRVRKS